MSIQSYVPNVFSSIKNIILEEDIFDNTVVNNISNLDKPIHVTMKEMNTKNDIRYVKPNIGVWDYELTIVLDSPFIVLRISYFVNKLFPGQFMMVGKISKPLNPRSYDIIAHGDYRVNNGILNMISILCMADHNTYYSLEMSFPTIINEHVDITITKSLERVKTGTLKFTYLNHYDSHEDEGFDMFLERLYTIPYQNILDMLPTPTSLSVERGSLPNTLKIYLDLYKESWEDTPDLIGAIHFVGTPLFMTSSTDLTHELLNPQNQSFHKFHTYTFEIKWDPKRKEKRLLVDKELINRYINLPVSIIFTIHRKEDVETNHIFRDFTTTFDKCKYIHQVFKDTPYLIPRYLFMDQMPGIKLEIYKITTAEFLIKVCMDRTLLIPFQADIYISDPITNQHFKTTFNETTSFIVFKVPYSIIQPSLKRKRLNVQYNVRFDKCRHVIQDHFIIMPVDDLCGGRTELIVEVGEFIATRGTSFEKHLFVLCDDCRKERKCKRDVCTKCYRYKCRQCEVCGNRLYLSTSNPSQFVIEERLIDGGSSFTFKHKKCHDSSMGLVYIHDSMTSDTPFMAKFTLLNKTT